MGKKGRGDRRKGGKKHEGIGEEEKRGKNQQGKGTLQYAREIYKKRIKRRMSFCG